MTALPKERHPESEFRSPYALAEARGLPAADRLARLKQWQLTVEDRLAASNEGMPSHGDNTADLTLLAQISAAIEKLTAGKD